jgi:PPOX class probable FMN-dependent enzyme
MMTVCVWLLTHTSLALTAEDREAMREEYLIRSTGELRELMGLPHAKVSQKITGSLDAHQVAFVARAPIAFVSTADLERNLEISPKGDAPGFVHVYDAKTLLIPERPGNKLAFGFENILETGKIGLIFAIPGVIETLRIGGSASISKDPKLLSRLSAQGKPALLCTIVCVEKCWFHCGKAFLRSKLWKPESWQPDARSNYSQQVAEAVKLDVQLVQKVVEDDYENNLY